jgi:hypothetical protein
VIDTCEVGWRCDTVGRAEIAAFRASVEGVCSMRSVSDTQGQGEHIVAWSGVVPRLGKVTLNVDGYLRVGGSLAKFEQHVCGGYPLEQCTNDRVLSAAAADRAFQAVCDRVEALYPFAAPSALSVARLDVVYQRPVRSSHEVLSTLRNAMKQTRKGCAWFDNAQGVATGLMLKGGVVASRHYDKGLEGGRSEYLNVLRSEEQLRHKAADFPLIFNAEQRSFDREECRRVMNERFLSVAYGGDLDVSVLLADGRDTMALLVLHPEFAHVHKQRVTRWGHYKMMRKVREFRAQAIPEDLRIPEDAWLQQAA